MSDAKESKNKTILVVDDDAIVLDIVEAFVEQQGHKVLCAQCGHEALKLANEHNGKLDLLLTDVIMPNMNGMDLAKTMVRNNPDLKVIFMSGCLQPAIDSPNAFIQKPFSHKTLTNHIKKAFSEMN